MTIVEELLPSQSVSTGSDELSVVVTERLMAADGVLLLTLRVTHADALPSWTPGAHIDLVLGNGVIRQYSLCGDPHDPSVLQVGVLLEPDGEGGSRYIHENLHVGTELSIKGPRNHFELVEAERYVFLAGGIGITPMLPMIREVESAGKPWSLYYAGRRLNSMAFRDELSRYGDAVHIAAADAGQRLNLDDILSASDTNGAVVYCCGPERLSAAASDVCKSGWPTGAFHVEHFVPKEIDESTNKEFTLRLEKSGLTLQVPADKSTMKAMEEAGVHVPCSCAAGTCGTCEVDVLEGEIEHRDSVLTDEERADNVCMMVCVSRAKSPVIVLDI